MAADAGTDDGEGSDDHKAVREFVVIVSIHVKPGREEEFLRLVTPVLDAMRHEATFINAALHRDPEVPTRFMLYETWADRDDLINVQMKRAYRSAHEARLPEILREPRQVQLWQPLRADFTFFAARATAGARLAG
jgi:quinol monooxygenase YgiN